MSSKERIRGGRSRILTNGSSISSINSSSSTKRTVVPNIAAAASRIIAPKWADTKPTASDAVPKQEGSKGEERGRGGSGGRRSGPKRGRGQGREGGSSRSIIASEGVFSMGIGFDDASMNRREMGARLKQIKDEEIIGKLENSLDESGSEEKTRTHKGKTLHNKIKSEVEKTATQYSEFWESDEELCREELDEICGGGSIISDLKKGEQAPFVLPDNEAQQFCRLVKRRRTGNAMDDGETVSDLKHQSLDFKDIKKNIGEPVAHNKFLLAAEKLQSIVNDQNGNDCLMLFQLPSMPLLRIAQARRKKKFSTTTTQNEPQNKEAANATADHTSPQKQSLELEAQQRNCLDSIAEATSRNNGRHIGKLQFLRSGRVALNICGQRLDVSEAIRNGCLETLLRVDLNDTAATQSQQQQNQNNGLYGGDAPFQFIPTNTQKYNISSSSGIIANSSSSSTNNNNNNNSGGIARLMGSLPFHFICSFDAKNMLGANSNNAASVDSPSETTKNKMPGPVS